MYSQQITSDHASELKAFSSKSQFISVHIACEIIDVK